MPMFKDLTEILDPYLDLPIGGKTYRVPAPTVAVGLRAQATVAIAAKVRMGQDVSAEDVAALKLDDEQEVQFSESMLTKSLFDEMVADGVTWEYVQHAAKTVFMWCVGDRDQAAEVWANQGNVNRPATQDRKPPARKKTSKKAASPSS